MKPSPVHMPSALERLIEPLPSELKAAVLEAWKNEDIPHDENDSVYRLMILLTLYVRYFEGIPLKLTAAEGRFTKLTENSLVQFEQLASAHYQTFGLAGQRLENLTGSLKNIEILLENKPKSLRLQFETDFKTLLSETQAKCEEIQTGMAHYWAKTKEDQETVIFNQHLTFLAMGIFIGILVVILVGMALRHSAS